MTTFLVIPHWHMTITAKIFDQTFDHYKCSYEEHITNIIDKLMLVADLDLGKEMNQSTQELIYEGTSQGDILAIVDNGTSNIVQACDERNTNNEKVKNLITDFNYPDKKFGYHSGCY